MARARVCNNSESLQQQRVHTPPKHCWPHLESPTTQYTDAALARSEWWLERHASSACITTQAPSSPACDRCGEDAETKASKDVESKIK